MAQKKAAPKVGTRTPRQQGAQQSLDAYIARQSERRQIALRRWAKRAIVFADASVDVVRMIVKDCGVEGARALLDVTAEQLDAKYATSPRRSQGGARPAVQKRFDAELQRARENVEHMQQRADDERGTELADVTRIGAQRARDSFAQMVDRHGKIGALAIIAATTDAPPEETPRSQRAALVDDVAQSVRLDSVSEGSTVKTPDSPSEGLAGSVATLVRLGSGSASVRLAATRRTIKQREGEDFVEFDAPGRLVTWALSTPVVVVERAR